MVLALSRQCGAGLANNVTSLVMLVEHWPEALGVLSLSPSVGSHRLLQWHLKWDHQGAAVSLNVDTKIA